MHDDPAEFAALAADLQAQPDTELTAEAIVKRLSDLVPGADHVSLTLRRRRGWESLASSDDVAAQADELQYELEQGPCLDAADDVAWVRSGHVGSDERWPAWGPRAAELGVASMLSVRLLRDDEPQGALNMYGRESGRFDDRDTIDVALVYAVHAATALTTARLVTDLQTALTSRHTIGMAQGMLMERFGLDEERSFDLLRRLSSSSETKLRDTAAALVRTRRLPGER